MGKEGDGALVCLIRGKQKPYLYQKHKRLDRKHTYQAT